MLDLVLLTPWFPNRPDGWPARYVSDSALALARLGHKVRVGVVRGYVPSLLERYASLEHRGQIDVAAFSEIENIRTFYYPSWPGDVLRKLKNYGLDRAVRNAVGHYITERRPDAFLVHTEMLAPETVRLASDCGIAVAVTLHGQNTNMRYLAAVEQKRRFRSALSQADHLVVVGSPLIDYAAELAGRADHIKVIWNGVDSPAVMRDPVEPWSAPIDLITVANLQEGKGVDLLIAALARLKDSGISNWRLRIIGTGPLEQALRIQVGQAGMAEQICFIGAVSNAEVFAQLARADVFILPSYREAFGVVYLEAMASGLLTIGVRDQGPAAFIDHGRTGLLLEPRSVDSIVSILKSLLQGGCPHGREIAAQGARFVRQEMTWAAHAVSLAALFEQGNKAI